MSHGISKPSLSPVDAAGWVGPHAWQDDRGFSVIRRVGVLLTVLFAELMLVRAWLNANAIEDTHSIVSSLAIRGTNTPRYVVVRFLVAFAVLLIVFGESQITVDARRRLARLARGPISGWLIAAHLAFGTFFAAISWLLFGTKFPLPVDIALTGAWLASGLATGAAVVTALVPAAFWRELTRTLRQVLVFSAVVSIGAFLLSRLSLVLWQPLSRSTLYVAYHLLHPLVPDLAMDASTLTMGNAKFSVLIMVDCSGYEGLGLMLAITTAWLWFHRSEWRFPRALLLVPTGLGAMWFFNCARVATLTLIGIAGAPEVAMGGFHSQAGWLGLTVVALGMCQAARNIPWLLEEHSATSDVTDETTNPAAAYLVPFLAILTAAMVAALASSGFEWLYPLRVAACAGALWHFRRSYRDLSWRPDMIAVLMGALVFILWVGLDWMIGGGVAQSSMPSALAAAPDSTRTIWTIARVVGAVVTVPIAEELAFRGFLMRQFKSDAFESVNWSSVSWIAVLLSSLAFGILHGDRWIAATLAGAVYAWLAIRRGSIGDAVVAHATTNALLAIAVLAGGYWQFW